MSTDQDMAEAPKEETKKGEGLDFSLDAMVAKQKREKYIKPDVPGEVKLIWIDDSSCVIKFASDHFCNLAF